MYIYLVYAISYLPTSYTYIHAYKHFSYIQKEVSESKNMNSEAPVPPLYNMHFFHMLAIISADILQ